MKVLWISDFGLHHNKGGAQRSNNLIVEKGKELGHDLVEFFFDSNESLLHPNYDLLVSSNLEAINRKPNIIQWISSHHNHVRVEHDSNRYLSPESRKTLFTSCKKAFILSSFHLKKFQESYGSYFINTEIVPDPIDSNCFYDKKEKREDKILYVGYMHQLKGTNELFSYAIENPEKDFVVAGWSDQQHFIQSCNMIPNIEFIGTVDFEEMPNLYNSYKTLFYKPAFYEPYCRSVAEAICCGMEIIGNDIIGCLHHMNEVGRDTMVSECATAPELFWEKVTCL